MRDCRKVIDGPTHFPEYDTISVFFKMASFSKPMCVCLRFVPFAFIFNYTNYYIK